MTAGEGPRPADAAWFERVAHLSSDLVTIFDPERLLQRIMETFTEAARVEKGSLMVPIGGRLEIRASVGLSDRARQLVRPRLGEGAAGRAASTGRPVLLDDTSGDALYVDFDGGEPRPRPKETLLCLPLVYRDEVLGVVNLDRKAGGGRFGKEDIARLSVLCNFAAVALANQRFYEASVTDGLTGLLSHKTFHIRLREEFARARRYSAFLSLIMLDLDHFKKFNDAHGHPQGDRALKHAARLLREATRSIDIVGRLGGEEFGVLLLETDLPSARLVAERIRSSVEKSRVEVDGKPVPLTVTLGVAAFTPADSVLTAEDLVDRADKALYRAKAEGRNRVVLWQEPSAST